MNGTNTILKGSEGTSYGMVVAEREISVKELFDGERTREPVLFCRLITYTSDYVQNPPIDYNFTRYVIRDNPGHVYPTTTAGKYV